MTKHTIQLQGPSARGARISMRTLRVLSDALIEVAQRATRLRVEGRSNLQGKASWLESAADVQLIGLRAGSTLLEIEAPALQEAAPLLFQQLMFWDDGPNGEDSAISFAESTLREAMAGNIDSDLLDRNILDAVARFQKVFDLGFSTLTIYGPHENAAVVMNSDGLSRAERLREEAPPSQRAIVSGVLEQLSGSVRGFRLQMSGGQIIRGILPAGVPQTYGPLWMHRVVVDGEARFRPSGALSLIAASHIQLASESDVAWDRMPRPRVRSLDDLKPKSSRAAGGNPMARIFGQWPGDETDEEVAAALEAIE